MAQLWRQTMANGQDEKNTLPVLLVDDDKMYTLALKRFLQRKNVPVTVCHRLSDALGQDSPQFRAAVIDVYIEGDMDGLRLLQRLRHLQPELPVIVITGMVSDEVRSAVRRAGANFLLAKPFRLARLFRLLEQLLCRPVLEKSGPNCKDILLAHSGVRSDLLADLLAVAGYRVHRAKSAEEAVRSVEEIPLLKAIVLQEALEGGASLVVQRADSLCMHDHILVVGESGEVVPSHWLPKECPRVELPMGPDEFLAALRPLLFIAAEDECKAA